MRLEQSESQRLQALAGDVGLQPWDKPPVRRVVMMCKDMTMDIFDLGLSLIDEREIYYLFLENCLEVVCGAGHTLSLEKFEDKMTIFISENKIKSSLRFLVTSCLKK